MHPRFGTDWRRRHPHHAASHAQHPGCCIPHEDAHKDPSLSDPMEIRLLLADLLTDKIKCLAKMAADALAQQHLRWHGDGIETANQRWLGKAGSIPKDAATPGNTNILSRIITQARISPRSSKMLLLPNRSCTNTSFFFAVMHQKKDVKVPSAFVRARLQRKCMLAPQQANTLQHLATCPWPESNVQFASSCFCFCSFFIEHPTCAAAAYAR